MPHTLDPTIKYLAQDTSKVTSITIPPNFQKIVADDTGKVSWKDKKAMLEVVINQLEPAEAAKLVGYDGPKIMGELRMVMLQELNV